MDGRRRGTRRKRRWEVALLCLMTALLHAGSRPYAAPSREITVSAAISLKDALEEIGRLFRERHPEARVLFNFGGSGDLAMQIQAGAPVDLFASADQKDMDDLASKNLVAANSRRDFAKNVIVLVTPRKSSLSIQSLTDLQGPEIKRVAIGNPKTVPAGRYAGEILRHFSLWDALKDKLIYAENARQVLDYVARDEVDASLVYSTDALARSKEVKAVMKVPEGSHQPVVYPMAIVKTTKEVALARAFADLVVSAEGQKIFAKYGFIQAAHRSQ